MDWGFYLVFAVLMGPHCLKTALLALLEKGWLKARVKVLFFELQWSEAIVVLSVVNAFC